MLFTMIVVFVISITVFGIYILGKKCVKSHYCDHTELLEKKAYDETRRVFSKQLEELHEYLENKSK